MGTRKTIKISAFGLGLLMLAAVLAFGCATIIHGTTQSVGVSSTPTNAKVIVDGQSYGNAPVTVELKRKKNHILRIELNGYEAYETTVTHTVSGWVFGNLVFGGLIGLAIDAVSGGMYELSPDHIHPTLKTARTSSAEGRSDDSLYISVVLHRDASWKKVGQLTRCGGSDCAEPHS